MAKTAPSLRAGFGTKSQGNSLSTGFFS